MDDQVPGHDLSLRDHPCSSLWRLPLSLGGRSGPLQVAATLTLVLLSP